MLAIKRVILLTNLLGIFCAVMNSRITLAQDKCEMALTDAEKLYAAGRFRSTVELLKPCLPDNVPPIHRERAYRLLALACIEEDYVEEAKVAINEILKRNCNYTGESAQDPKRYLDLLAEVKAQKSCSRPIWLWVAAAGVVTTVGAIYYIITLGESSPDEPLPEPPGLPVDK